MKKSAQKKYVINKAAYQNATLETEQTGKNIWDVCNDYGWTDSTNPEKFSFLVPLVLLLFRRTLEQITVFNIVEGIASEISLL